MEGGSTGAGEGVAADDMLLPEVPVDRLLPAAAVPDDRLFPVVAPDD